MTLGDLKSLYISIDLVKKNSGKHLIFLITSRGNMLDRFSVAWRPMKDADWIDLARAPEARSLLRSRLL